MLERLLVGEAGTGKTTLIRAALQRQPEGTRCISLNNPSLTRGEFVEFLAGGFGLSDEAARSKARFLFELENVLKERASSGAVTALVVDEAQGLSDELLEEIRLLANIETETEKLLPVVLAGQPELADRLNRPSVRQLKQRVALRCDLTPLTLTEVAAYVAGRIRTAGGDGTALFTREALTLIYERSLGIPRTISVLCDNALLGAFAAAARPVTRQMVLEVCGDFDLHGAAGPPSDSVPAERSAKDGAATLEGDAAATSDLSAAADAEAVQPFRLFTDQPAKKRFVFF